ncbi:MAG: 6-phosphogluconolactonase [Candidatus Eremiobacteraeota bacterium]|nr:6-phosphogluconolactonase [Candidatus Eremiobacteraeota bacterium]
MTGEIVVLESLDDVAQALADQFVVDAQGAVAERGCFYVALAGGSTPRPAYKLLAREPRIDKVQWKDVFIYFGDERCVPPHDDQSNYKAANETFLTATNIPLENIHRMKGEDDPQTAAAQYMQDILRDLGDPPQFDLILLGMGPEGHTASLFPGSVDPHDTSLVAAPFVAKFGTYRLTLTPRAINAARHVVIATAGEEKAQALAAALHGAYDPNTYPVQLIQPVDGRLTWLVDRTAAGQL